MTTIMIKNEAWVEPDWDFLDYARRLEDEWKQVLREEYPRTDKELLAVFQPTKQTLNEKVSEWQRKRDEAVSIIKKKLLIIRGKAQTELSKWFWREWVKVNEGEKLLEIDRNIGRLRRLLFTRQGHTPKESRGVTQEQIDYALTVPIENFNIRLKKSGSKLVGLCPLHNEKTPSFFVYLKNNSFYCYGCGVGGNVINLIKLLHELNFIETVKLLNNK
ncbi:MAG: CHC2 zinc finger domain-containing protein [Patescibacteria group bacterium]|nr:CHC2 zinc finger domain-containing protein [Patescibacteria group bacterium]